jgi:hypothetical protein
MRFALINEIYQKYKIEILNIIYLTVNIFAIMLYGIITAVYIVGAGVIGACIGKMLAQMYQERTVSFENDDDDNDNISYPNLFLFSQGSWRMSDVTLGRPLSTVFLDETIKTNLNSSISDFLENREWYRDSYIPYKMGILLCGGLGEGKTSLISALAYENDLDIYYVSINNGDVLTQINNIPKEHINIVVFENLDLELSQLGDRYPFVYPRLLNVMDGLLSPQQIFVVTTTSLDAIPEEFKRPGRFTHVVHINPPTKDLIALYFQSFYDETTPEEAAQFASRVVDGTSMCVVQNHLLKHRKNPVDAVANAKLIGL